MFYPKYERQDKLGTLHLTLYTAKSSEGQERFT